MEGGLVKTRPLWPLEAARAFGVQSAHTRAGTSIAAEYLAGVGAGLAFIGSVLSEFLHSSAASTGGGSRPPWGSGRVAVLARQRPQSRAGGRVARPLRAVTRQ